MQTVEYNKQFIDDCLDIYNFNIKLYEKEGKEEFKHKADEQLNKMRSHLNIFEEQKLIVNSFIKQD